MSFSKPVWAANGDEEIVIATGSEPGVRLVASFQIGLLAGRLGAIPDFFEPMDVDDLDLWEGGP